MLIIKKPTSRLLALFSTICITASLITGCTNTITPDGKGTDSVCVPNSKDTSSLGKIDHHIPKAEIMQFRKAFNADSINAKNPGLFITESEGFNKTQLLELLQDPACVGIRIYYGIAKGDKRNELRMIIVGTNNQGKDLYIKTGSKAATRLTQDEMGLEYGQCCHGEPVQ